MTEKPTVILTRELPTAWIEHLAERCHLHRGPAEQAGFAPELVAVLAQAEGLLCMLTETVDDELLAGAPKLRVVSNMAVGVDNIDVAACTARGIPVGHTPGVLTEATADLTMALLLSAARRIPEAAGDARAGRWDVWSPTRWLGSDLRGATLGIVGLGKIGAAVAERARAFGLELVHSSRTPKPKTQSRLGVRPVGLEELLRTSDFISLHVPLADDTVALIGEPQLRTMKPTATLINVARGPIVDSRALERALREGWIRGAALDVTDPEPLPATDPLFALPNCLIAPHIGSATEGTRRKMAALACDNLLAGLAGQRLPHCINPQVYEPG